MMMDQRRVEAYKKALESQCKDKVVVDVGAGTGVLSIFAAEFGAKKVIAIENASIYKSCKKEVNKRNLQGVIKVMNCLAEQAPISQSEVDLIVSEWMGYFLLFERMLPSVLSVRDQCLRQGGLIIPGRVKLLLAAASLSKKPENVIIEDQGGVLTL